MSPFKTFAAVALAIIAIPLTACSEDAATLTPAQKQQMEQLVHDYLLNNPEVIIESLTAMQDRKSEAAQQRQRDAMGALENDLKNSPNDPVLGNPKGDVTMVEFFDYRCGFCKRVHNDVQTLLKEDGNIRLVLKEFPILGQDSIYAARVAQAVWLNQADKYAAFHDAMMTSKGELNKAKVLELAASAGVDTAALDAHMNDPRVDQTLETTANQAATLDISGTPAFVFGTEIQPGAIPLETMKEMIAAMRKHP